MAYYNVKRHKKTRFLALFRRYIFRKTTGGGVKLTPSAFLGLIAIIYYRGENKKKIVETII